MEKDKTAIIEEKLFSTREGCQTLLGTIGDGYSEQIMQFVPASPDYEDWYRLNITLIDAVADSLVKSFGKESALETLTHILKTTDVFGIVGTAYLANIPADIMCPDQDEVLESIKKELINGMDQKDDILKVIYNRGTSTYKNGKLDFSRGEGGNNHIHAYDAEGKEIGYIWFDTHCVYYGFCGKSENSCNGIFRDTLRRLYPKKWDSTNLLFSFTQETFAQMMHNIIDMLR